MKTKVALVLYSLAIAVASSGITTIAKAEDKAAVLWAHVGPWDVKVNRQHQDGCFMQSATSAGLGTRVGFAAFEEDGKRPLYWMLWQDSWSLEPGRLYYVNVEFNGGFRWHGNMLAVRSGNGVRYLTQRVDPDFTRQFAFDTGFRLYYRSQLMGHAQLNGTRAAMYEMARCQITMNGGDPDAVSTRRSDGVVIDPFR